VPKKISIGAIVIMSELQIKDLIFILIFHFSFLLFFYLLRLGFNIMSLLLSHINHRSHDTVTVTVT